MEGQHPGQFGHLGPAFLQLDPLLPGLRLRRGIRILRIRLLRHWVVHEPGDVSAIAAKVDPGLVDINTTLGYQSEQAAGTGIVLTSSGEILTNNHVIDGATTISATDVGNGKTYSASVVGYDRSGDVAVLQLHNASGLQTASIDNSSNVAVGEIWWASATQATGQNHTASGTVTALNQSITASDQGDRILGAVDRAHPNERRHSAR